LCRFIPAHAGNSFSFARDRHREPVHPRARGEQIRTRSREDATRGSSPRTRGTGWGISERGAQDRFIPAHAGNRSACLLAMHRQAVHPRARGEQRAVHPTQKPVAGSSPRTRGTGKYSGSN